MYMCGCQLGGSTVIAARIEQLDRQKPNCPMASFQGKAPRVDKFRAYNASSKKHILAPFLLVRPRRPRSTLIVYTVYIYTIYIYNIYIIYILYIIFIYIYILYFIYAYNVLQFSAVPMIHSHSWTLTDLTETTQAGRFKAAAGLFSEAGHPCYTLVHQYWIYLDRFILGLPCIHIYLCLSIFIHAGVFSYLEVGALFAILHPQHPSKLTIHILNQNSISRYFRVRVQMTCLFSHVCLSPSLERYQTSP